MPPISPSDRLLGDLLVARDVLTLEQLDEAVRLAETWQVRLGDAILSRSWSDPQHYYRTIAEHFDLPFVEGVTERGVSSVDYSLLRTHLNGFRVSPNQQRNVYRARRVHQQLETPLLVATETCHLHGQHVSARLEL